MSKILLVEDDHDDQRFFLDALLDINSEAECQIANNGDEALQTLDSFPLPDIMFLDLNMPIMNGFDCLVELRKKENLADLKVVIFTTTSDLATIKQTHALGADLFFKKPNDIQTMRFKLQRLLQMDFSKLKNMSSFSFAQYSL